MARYGLPVPSDDDLRQGLRAFALTLPGAYEDFPWGEVVVKVNKKIFAFLGSDGPSETRGFAVKLVESHEHALSIPGAAPSGYGLGKAGWVLVPLAGEIPELGVLADFVEESYRVVAPRRLVDELDARSAPG